MLFMKPGLVLAGEPGLLVMVESSVFQRLSLCTACYKLPADVTVPE